MRHIALPVNPLISTWGVDCGKQKALQGKPETALQGKPESRFQAWQETNLSAVCRLLEYVGQHLCEPRHVPSQNTGLQCNCKAVQIPLVGRASIFVASLLVVTGGKSPVGPWQGRARGPRCRAPAPAGVRPLPSRWIEGVPCLPSREKSGAERRKPSGARLGGVRGLPASPCVVQ